MKEQKRMIDITAVCLIPIVCIWMKNSYEHYTAKQISIFIGIMFLLINGCLFLKEKRKKEKGYADERHIRSNFFRCRYWLPI